jgi:hypothetical protein
MATNNQYSNEAEYDCKHWENSEELATPERPKNYYHGTSLEALKGILINGLAVGSFVSTDFQWSVYYAFMANPHPDETVMLEIQAPVREPDEKAFDEERITIGSARIIKVYRPKFSTIPEDWMEPNPEITSQLYPELFSIENWQLAGK